MIRNIQITGEQDLHPEKPIYDASQLAKGQIDISSLRVNKHNIRVFDLMDEDNRRSYEDLYVYLSNEAKKGSIYIISNTRETLTRSDGSTGWFKFIEWTEFDTSEILGA